MSEQIVSVTAPAQLFATVRGVHVPVIALAVVRILDASEGEDAQPFDVIKAVVVGPSSEDGLCDLADVHDASDCNTHESTEPVPMRRRGVA